MSTLALMATQPNSTGSRREPSWRKATGWWFVASSAGIGAAVGTAWLTLTGLSDFDTPNPGVRTTAWVVLVIGVAVAAIPATLGFRRLGVQGLAATYFLGLLVATPAALIIVVPNL